VPSDMQGDFQNAERSLRKRGNSGEMRAERCESSGAKRSLYIFHAGIGREANGEMGLWPPS